MARSLTLPPPQQIMISPSATSGLGWKHGMRQWVRKVATRIGLAAMAAGGRPPLAIENAGDHRVRVEGRQAAHEVQRSFISSNCCWS